MNLSSKSVISNGQSTRILISNVDEPNALVALANALILNPSNSGAFKELAELVKRNNVMERDLEKALISIGSKCCDERSSVDSLAEHLAEANINDVHDTKNRVMQLARMLPSLVDVDPVFDGTFTDVAKIRTFQLYGVNLLHGWIIDNNEDPHIYEEICGLSSKKAEIAMKSTNRHLSEKINYFLSKSDSQLTEKGLEHLKTSVKEGQFAVMFRRNKFYTLHKKEGELFYLMAYKDLGKTAWHPLRFINNHTITSDPGVVDDALFRHIQLWLYSTVENLNEEDRSRIEIEMKYGIMTNPKTKRRIRSHSSTPTIYNGRVNMRPNLDETVFRKFKQYMKFKYGNRGIRSTTQDSMYHVRADVHGPRRLRESTDLRTGDVEKIVEKRPIDSIFICRPNDSYDMKLSISLELPVTKEEISKNHRKRVNVRKKDRVSYIHSHPGSRIDITHVTNNPHLKKESDTTHEIEVEMTTGDLLSGWGVKDKDSVPTNCFARMFLSTANIIEEKLTSLAEVPS